MMKDLSFTQEFLLCALKPKGNTTLTHSIESTTCLFAGALLELLMDDYIKFDEKDKVFVKHPLPVGKDYLTLIYDFISTNKPMKIESLAEKFTIDFKGPDKLFQLTGQSMLKDGYIVEESGKGLFKNKRLFIPNENEVSKVIEKLRAEFLEPGEISDEVMALGALLNKSGLIKKYFSKYEIQKLNERLKEVNQSEAGLLIKKLVDYIDSWIVLTSIIASSI